jgi:hypothetical protein
LSSIIATPGGIPSSNSKANGSGEPITRPVLDASSGALWFCCPIIRLALPGDAVGSIRRNAGGLPAG